MRKVFSLPILCGLLLFLALASCMYRSTTAYLLSNWNSDDFTYSYFIPVVVAYLIWEKRAELAREPAQRSWAGMLPALLGILFYWMGALGGEFTIMFVSLWLLCVAALWSIMGWRKLRVIIFPVFMALTMVPPPVVLYNGLTLRLKLMSSQIGVKMLQLCGMSAYREGNVIDLGFTKLQVVDACSGLRYFFPLIVLGILLAYFFKGALWKRILIVLSAVPVSIVTNSMRIASVGILYQFMGAAAAEGFFHDFSGWFIFMVSLGVLVLEMAVLKRIFPDKDGEQHEPPADGKAGMSSVEEHDQRPGLLSHVAPQIVLILLLMGLSVAGVMGGGTTQNRVPLKKTFAEFPETVAGWSGKRQVMEKMFLDELGLNDYLLTDFRNGSGELINCYIGFNDSQTKGKATHSPESCLPGSGWELRDPDRIQVPDGTGRGIVINRAIMVKGAERQLTYYWFDQRGRILTDLYQIKFYNFLDSVIKKRTDGALVRLITPLANGESPDGADARLKGFVRELYPVLNRFLPS
ncbi:MAG: VPLPA-CTERM-specific exosortase XrtD [Desulfuromonadales bacterium]|nr:VPLPA-CTERM-specific exosortase XrtD [Desulfuromonadales bacterium]